jgi:hypothetical protein
MKVLLASFEPRRDRTPAGWPFVRKPTRHASNRQFESQPTETRGRYEHTLNARPDPPSGRSVSSPLPGSHPAPASTTPLGGPRRPPGGRLRASSGTCACWPVRHSSTAPGSARGSMCVPPYASEASSRPRQMRGQAGRGVGGDRRSDGPGRSACIRGRGTPARNRSAMLAGLRAFCSSSRLEHQASARCGQSRGAVLAHPVPPLGAAPRSHVAWQGRCEPVRADPAAW